MLLAVLVTVGALRPRTVPLPALLAVAAVAAGAWVRRRPLLVCVAACLLASALAGRAEQGLADPPAGVATGVAVTLASDPAPVGPGRTAIGRAGGRHVQLVAFGRAGRALGRRLAGEIVVVDGRWTRVAGRSAASLRARHVAARLQVEVVREWRPGTILASTANRVRRTLDRGSRVMAPVERSLFLGLVIGDDRDEPADVVADFRAGGLSHLTAVSGENVAFVLVCLAPLLRRLPLRARWLATLAVVAWFALLTRFEPSVVRAAAMAGLAATASFLDRTVSGVRLLALAVSGAVLVDAFLVRSVGWWLSVGATAGLVLLSAPLAARLPGPRWLAQPVAVTAAAQVGVAPVSLVLFGPMPLAALPANLLAQPAAGPLMVWGLPAGLLAGLVPASARLVHLPSTVLVRWIALVARVGATLPGSLAAAPLALSATVVTIVILARTRAARRCSGTVPGSRHPPTLAPAEAAEDALASGAVEPADAVPSLPTPP